MRASIRTILAGLILLALWAAPVWAAPATAQDTIADHELGQPGMTTGGDNQGGLSASSLNGPATSAVDRHTGRLYVDDNGNNRVLSWPNAHAFANGQAADIVIGQPNFTTVDLNHGGLSSQSLSNPQGVAVDAQGNLYVGDTDNNRVLIYTAPLTNHAAASAVLGQPNFTTGDSNHGGLNAQSLSNPGGVAVDGNGVVYVADSANNRVMYYQPQPATDGFGSAIGQPSTITNTANNPTLSADTLWFPAGVGVDRHDNLYVADTANNRVLEYDHPPTNDLTADHVIGQPAMNVNTLNYNGLSATSLNGPVAVTADLGDSVYVADQGNNRVLEYNDPNIIVMPTATMVFGQPDATTGDANHGGSITASTLSVPSGVMIDNYDNLFVTDFNNNRLLEYDAPLGNPGPELDNLSPSFVATTAGSFTLTVNGAFFTPDSLVKWNGSTRPTTYLSSTQLKAAISAADIAAGPPFPVTVFTPAPVGGTDTAMILAPYVRASEDSIADLEFGQPSFITQTANNPNMPDNANRLWGPPGVAIDPRSGRLFVSDEYNNRVLSWASPASLANGQAADLVIGQPNLFFTDPNHGGRSAHTLNYPTALTVDQQGNLYVADRNNNRVLVYAAPLTSGMAAHLVFGQGGSFITGRNNQPAGSATAGNLFAPDGVAVDGQGNLFVSDDINSRVLEFNAPLTSGSANRVFGQPSFIADTSNYNGVTATSLSFPRGIALDRAGNLYVADLGNSRVLEYLAPLSTAAAADLVLGQPNFTSHALLAASATSLAEPFGLVLDAHGNLFVADSQYNRVLEYNAPVVNHAAATHVYGQPDVFSSLSNNGGISRSSLAAPQGLALDTVGNLYVADLGNARVLEYDLPLPFQDYVPLVRR